MSGKKNNLPKWIWCKLSVIAKTPKEDSRLWGDLQSQRELDVFERGLLLTKEGKGVKPEDVSDPLMQWSISQNFALFGLNPPSLTYFGSPHCPKISSTDF